MQLENNSGKKPLEEAIKILQLDKMSHLDKNLELFKITSSLGLANMNKTNCNQVIQMQINDLENK